MKKAILTGAVVGIVILALGVTGFAYAQTQNPMNAYLQEETEGTYPYGPGAMGHGGYGRGARGNGFGQGMIGRGAFGEGQGLLHDYMAPALADAFGLTVEELEALHDSGETLWGYTQEQGISQEEFFSLKQAAHTEALNQAVADGVISQEQADWMQDHMGGAAGFGRGTGECHGNFGSGDYGYGMRGSRGGWNTQP
jgi:hypothetical protein